LKHFAENRKRRLSALTNVGPYTYYVKVLALQGAPYIYDISRLRVKPLVKEPPGFIDCVPTAAVVAVGREISCP
jgi:hypothetical protein